MVNEDAWEGSLRDLPRDQILALVQKGKVDGKILDGICRTLLHDQEMCRAILQHPEVSVETLCYLAKNADLALAELIAQDEALLRKSAEIWQALTANPRLSPEVKNRLQKYFKGVGQKLPQEKEQKKDLYRMIKELSAGQRLALAKRGNKEVRMILIRDANEMIALEVVSSPRITDSEIMHISQMRDVSEKILRAIGTNRKYRSNKAVILNLLHNPKTPVSISLGLGITRLSDRELTGLARSKNVPGALSRAAAMTLEKRKKTTSIRGGGH